MPEKKLSKKKIWLFHVIMLLIPFVVISLSYLTYVTYRTNLLYNKVKSNKRGWSGKVWQPDKNLGFAPIPNSYGSEIMPFGANVPVRYDKDGFRIPIKDKLKNKKNRPVVLTLGCSFTYGAATRAEDTFPYLVGKYIGGSTKNAGVCSYGLSQMMVIAKRLIPRYKPDYVIVQYSNWLVNRAIRTFAPSYFGKLPGPYFAGEDHLVLKPPVFQTKIWDVPVDEYRYSPKGADDFLSFLWNVGLPLFLYDDFNVSVYTITSILGLKDLPTTNRRAVIQYAYAEIYRAAQEGGAKMIIVVLGSNNKPVKVPKEVLPNDVLVVDAQRELLRQLPAFDSEAYDRQYRHWGGDPPRLVDRHPNEKAHRIIAEQIISDLAKSSNKTN